MRPYTQQHPFYCGVDLHARSMYVHILDDQNQTRFAQDLPASPAAFLDAITIPRGRARGFRMAGPAERRGFWGVAGRVP